VPFGAPSVTRTGSFRHGFYTAEEIVERKATRAWIRSIQKTQEQKPAISSSSIMACPSAFPGATA
jgi:hypothetical protein